MFSGAGIQNVDGTEWYFPQRLTDDTGAVDNGNANPAQSVLDVDATMGHDLPKSLLIYAFGAPARRARRVLEAAQILAQQSGIPHAQSDAGQRAEHLRPQRPGRRLPEQRLLRSPGAVPAEGQPRLVVAQAARKPPDWCRQSLP